MSLKHTHKPFPIICMRALDNEDLGVVFACVQSRVTEIVYKTKPYYRIVIIIC